MISILPASVDQLMHVRITPETKAFLLQSNKELDPTAFDQVIDTIEEIIIAQAPNGQADAYSIIVLKGKENFSIEQIKTIGLLYAETWYVSQELTPWTRLYGDPASVNYYSLPGNWSLTDKPELKTILTTAAKQQASVLFYSTPGTQLGNDPLALAFANKLQYTALYGTPGIDSSKWSFVLQFTGTNFTRSDTVFTPKHDNQITDRTVLYLEWKELLSTFGVSASQFSTMVPLLLSNMPWANTLLPNDQISHLYAGLNSNIGILLDVTETVLGVWLRLRFNDPAIYDSLASVQPLLRWLINPLAGSWIINEKREENSWTLSVDLDPTLWVWSWEQSSWTSISFPLLSLDKDTATTTLSILPNPTPVDNANKKLMYTADSLLTLRYDPAVLIDNAKLNPFLNNFVNQLTLLGTWALIANITIDDTTQQLIATFESK